MAPCKPWKNGKAMKNEVQFTLVIPVEDGDDEKVKIGEKITLVLFHEPCMRN